jgi:hypothetical protein
MPKPTFNRPYQAQELRPENNRQQTRHNFNHFRNYHENRNTRYYARCNGNQPSSRYDNRRNQNLNQGNKQMPSWRGHNKYVPFCLMAHHTAIHQSTGVTPFSMMFGTQIRLPIDLLIGAPLVDNPEKENRYASDYVRKLEEKTSSNSIFC